MNIREKNVSFWIIFGSICAWSAYGERKKKPNRSVLADCIVYNSLWIYNIYQNGKLIQKHQFIIVRTLHCSWIIVVVNIILWTGHEFTEHPGTHCTHSWYLNLGNAFLHFESFPSCFVEFQPKSIFFNQIFGIAPAIQKKREGIQHSNANQFHEYLHSEMAILFRICISIDEALGQTKFKFVYFIVSITWCVGMRSVCFLYGDKTEHSNGMGDLSAFVFWMYA